MTEQQRQDLPYKALFSEIRARIDTIQGMEFRDPDRRILESELFYLTRELYQRRFRSRQKTIFDAIKETK